MNKLVKTNTKLKTGDEVVVISGKDIGKKGTAPATIGTWTSLCCFWGPW